MFSVLLGWLQVSWKAGADLRRSHQRQWQHQAPPLVPDL